MIYNNNFPKKASQRCNVRASINKVDDFVTMKNENDIISTSRIIQSSFNPAHDTRVFFYYYPLRSCKDSKGDIFFLLIIKSYWFRFSLSYASLLVSSVSYGRDGVALLIDNICRSSYEFLSCEEIFCTNLFVLGDR